MAGRYTLPGLRVLPGAGTKKSVTATLLRAMESGFKGSFTQLPGGGISLLGKDFIGFRFQTTTRFNQGMEYLEKKFPKQVRRISGEVNENVVLQLMEDAERGYRRAQRANRRPGATGKLLRHLSDPREYRKFARSTEGMASVNFNVLDLYVKSERGFPYWRSVNYGYRRFEVHGRALFIMQSGRFTMPNPGSNKRDPGLLQKLGRGATFTIGFEGYDFIGPAIDNARSGVKQDYGNRIKEGLGELGEPRAASILRLFIGGATVDRGGQIRMNGRWATGPLGGRLWPNR